MNGRRVLFGYCYVDGEIKIHSQESEVFKEMVRAYIEGKSLLALSQWLNERQVEYAPGTTGWNKSRIMRLLTDERYLGTDKFPALIDQASYDMIQTLKNRRLNQQDVNRHEFIYQMGVPVRCPNCGETLRRKVNHTLKQSVKWICQNNDCKTTIRKADEALVRDIKVLLNKLIADPNIVVMPQEPTIGSSMELQCQEKELEKMMNCAPLDRKQVREKVIGYYAKQYAEMDSSVCVSQKLRDVFREAEPMREFSREVFDRTADEIYLYQDGEIGIVLENGQEVR